MGAVSSEISEEIDFYPPATLFGSLFGAADRPRIGSGPLESGAAISYNPLEVKNMRKIAATVMMCLWTATLVFAQSTARLSEMRTSRSVDPKLQSPIGVTETFGPEAKPIYLSVKLSDAPQGTQVKIVAYYLQNGTLQQIAAQNFPDVYGTGYLSSRINPPSTGWFLGKYKAVFYLNGQEQGSIWFSVVSDKAGPGPVEYRTFTSRANGFSIQYPAKWVEGVKGSSNVACMFLATPDNSPVASLNVQVVPISGGDDSRSREAVNLVAQQLIDQITGVLKGRIRKDTWTTAEANTGRELDSEYTYQGANIRQRQFLTYHAGKVFVLILTADQEVYNAYVGHYSNAAKTLKFQAK